MAIYTFKVSPEDNENVYRNIEIKSIQKFSDFHDAILDAYKFDKKHSASFYMSNDQWHKGAEISSDKSKKTAVKMEDAVLKNFIEDPHQKIYFVYDFIKEWTFLIELLTIQTAVDNKKSYPVCIKISGIGPKQYPSTGKKKQEAPSNDNEDLIEKNFHEETFLFEEDEMEKDAESLEEGLESFDDTDSSIDELPASELEENI